MSALKTRVKQLQALSGLDSYEQAAQIYRCVGNELTSVKFSSPAEFLDRLSALSLERMKAAARRSSRPRSGEKKP